MSDIFDDLVMEQEPVQGVSEEQNFAQAYETFIEHHVRGEAVRMLEDPTFDLSQGDVRFSTALPLNLVRATTVAIVGAGGLGNWQWRILMGMGFRNIHIFDDDVVGIENIGPQAHSIMDIGLPKVEAVRRAGMFYRGVNLHTHQKRIMTYQEMVDSMGCTPDIIIGCTDSAEFRNSFIKSMFGLEIPEGVDPDDRVDESSLFTHGLRMHQLPKLWLDYRMSLGDWTCYAMPVRAMYNAYTREDGSISGDIKYYVIKYVDEACFSQDEAVQEACTERAICYTGAQVASFTGAYVHWFLTMASQVFGSEERLVNYFKNWENRQDTEAPLQFLWRTIFSARDFEFISASRKEYKLQNKLSEARTRRTTADTVLTQQFRNQYGVGIGRAWRVRSHSDDYTMRLGVRYVPEDAKMDVYPVFVFDGRFFSYDIRSNSVRNHCPSDLLFVEHDYFLGDTVLRKLQDGGLGWWMHDRDHGNKFCVVENEDSNTMEVVNVASDGTVNVIRSGAEIVAFLCTLCNRNQFDFEHCEAPSINQADVEETPQPAEETAVERVPAVVGGLVDLSNEGFETPLRWEEQTSQYNVLRDVDTGETVRVAVRIDLWAPIS